MRFFNSLFARSTVLIFVLMMCLQTLLAFMSAKFLVLPLVHRSASDLADLILLDAHTYRHLPIEQRAEYAQRILSQQQLTIETNSTNTSAEESWLPYIQLLAYELSQRTHQNIQIWQNDQQQFWIDLPVDSAIVRVRFSRDRIGTQPEAAFIAIFIGTLLISFLTALILARSLTRPLASLDLAAQSLGHGARLDPIPETGPREIAQLAHRFNIMAQQVRELLDNRTTLLAGISHDLRTPIARLRLALELAHQNPHDDHFLRCERYLDEMSELLSVFLDFSRGVSHHEKLMVELRSFMLDIQHEQTHQIELCLASDLPEVIDIAESSLRRVIMNLLENAIRYASDQSIELCCERDKTHIQIDVRDRGPGIPPDQFDAVTRPFVRLESSRSARTGGSGLGLAIVKQICLSQGWQFSLHPRPDRGLIARIRLPFTEISQP